MVDLKKIFEEHENVNIEVKSAEKGVPSSVWDTYSSFANTFGGTIILGIGEDRKTKKFLPLGVDNPEQIILDIWNTLNNRQKISANILLEHHVYSCTYQDRDYVVMEVPRAERTQKPVFIGEDMFKGSFKRNHEGDYHCTKEEVKAMLRDQSDTSADSLILDNLPLSVLNPDSINSYRIKFSGIRQNHFWNNLRDDEFLMKIGAARMSESDGRIHPTLGGLIFFGNYIDIMNELPYYFLDYREKDLSDKRWIDRVCSSDPDWSGNVYDFYFRIYNKLTSDVKTPFELDKNGVRVEETAVHKALRECLANALVHADYYGRQGVVIEKEFTHITFANPGTFRIDVNEAIAGGISDARNTRIFNMFSLINIGERSGTGLCDVFNVWKEYGYREPEIIESVSPDRVIISVNLESSFNVLSEVVANSEVNVANSEVNVANSEVNVANSKELGANRDEFGANRKDVGANRKDVGANRKDVGANRKDVGANRKDVGANRKDVGANRDEFGANRDEFVTNRDEFGANASGFVSLDYRNKDVYLYISQNTYASITEISDNLGFAKRTVQRSLKELIDGHYVRREGTRKKVHWIILK